MATQLWTGAVSSDWFDAGNWTYGVPVLGQLTDIPDVGPNPFPIINGPTAVCGPLEIQNGASLTVLPTGVLTVEN